MAFLDSHYNKASLSQLKVGVLHNFTNFFFLLLRSSKIFFVYFYIFSYIILRLVLPGELLVLNCC